MNVTDLPILTAITFVPLVGSVAIALLPRTALGAIRGVALGTALATWVFSLILAVGFLPGRPGSVHRGDGWIPTSASSTRSASTASRWRSSS
jgi:NADH:ubiquinone oxidoreductase subunit 4 (subunit M)